MTGNPLDLTARLVWGAMLVAVGIYYAILLGVAGTRSAQDPGFMASLHGLLLAAASANSLAVWALHRRYLARSTEPAAVARGLDPQRAFTVLVVCWALGESIALFGLVLGILGRVDALFFLWALAVLLAVRPRADYFSAPASVSSQPR